MEIRTKDEKYILIFYHLPPVTIDNIKDTVELELPSKKSLLQLKEKIEEILQKEQGD